MKINPYVNYNGTCEEAFRFYAQCLGGKIETLMNYAGSPAAEHAPPEWQSKVLHASLRVGDAVLLGSDSPPEYYRPPGSLYITLSVDSASEAERIYEALSEGAEIRMPMDETFFAVRFGMLADRFGTPWMIICERPMP